MSGNLFGQELDSIEFVGDRKDELGWYYKDKPHHGFVVLGEAEPQYHTKEGEPVEVTVGLAVDFQHLGDSLPGKEGAYLADGRVVVHPDDLTEGKLKMVMGGSGKDEEGATYEDVSRYGISVPVDDAEGESWEEAYKKIEDSIRFGEVGIGFILDKPWNRMGNTGWDVIRDCTEEEFDKTEAAMERGS